MWWFFKYIQTEFPDDVLDFFEGLFTCNCDNMGCHRKG